MLLDFITDDIKTEAGLTDDQLAKLAPAYESHIASKQQEWDGKANENAENIILGAINSTAKAYDVDLPRNQGEKNADYLARLNHAVVGGLKTQAEKLKADYEKKLKEVGDGSATARELAEVKEKYDSALQKYADFDTLKEKAEKLDPLENEYKSLKERVFFQNEKPAFPETVNKYEADAKWAAFTKAFDEKWDKTFDENGKSIAVSKENPHLKKSLAELVTGDAELSALLAGRQQRGTGAGPANPSSVEGLFDVQKGADSAEITKAVDNYLINTKQLSKTSTEYSEQFAALYEKAKKAAA